MTVYVLLEGDYDDETVAGVYSTLQKAKARHTGALWCDRADGAYHFTTNTRPFAQVYRVAFDRGNARAATLVGAT